MIGLTKLKVINDEDSVKFPPVDHVANLQHGLACWAVLQYRVVHLVGSLTSWEYLSTEWIFLVERFSPNMNILLLILPALNPYLSVGRAADWRVNQVLPRS